MRENILEGPMRDGALDICALRLFGGGIFFSVRVSWLMRS